VASLLKRWLLGTHQGAVRPKQLDYYLDEFTFGSIAGTRNLAASCSIGWLSKCSSRAKSLRHIVQPQAVGR